MPAFAPSSCPSTGRALRPDHFIALAFYWAALADFRLVFFGFAVVKGFHLLPVVFVNRGGAAVLIVGAILFNGADITLFFGKAVYPGLGTFVVIFFGCGYTHRAGNYIFVRTEGKCPVGQVFRYCFGMRRGYQKAAFFLR